MSFVLMPVIAESFIFCAQLAYKSAAASHIKLAAFWFSLILTGILNFFTVNAVFKHSK